ncbi:hypothetical protein HPB47_005784, partial [Ixodes persulcatus]
RWAVGCIVAQLLLLLGLGRVDTSELAGIFGVGDDMGRIRALAPFVHVGQNRFQCRERFSGVKKMGYDNHEEDFLSWDGFKAAFSEVFGKLESRRQRAQDKLARRYQAVSESSTGYIEDVIRLCSRADPAMTEEDKIRHIFKGSTVGGGSGNNDGGGRGGKSYPTSLDNHPLMLTKDARYEPVRVPARVTVTDALSAPHPLDEVGAEDGGDSLHAMSDTDSDKAASRWFRDERPLEFREPIEASGTPATAHPDQVARAKMPVRRELRVLWVIPATPGAARPQWRDGRGVAWRGVIVARDAVAGDCRQPQARFGPAVAAAAEVCRLWMSSGKRVGPPGADTTHHLLNNASVTNLTMLFTETSYKAAWGSPSPTQAQ